MDFSLRLHTIIISLTAVVLILSSCSTEQPVTPTSTPTATVTPLPTLTATATSIPESVIIPTPVGGRGGQIVFSLDFFGDLNYDLYQLDLSCMSLPDACSPADLLRLTDITGFVMHPHFSPRGDKIAFMSEEEIGGSFLFSMNPDGTGIEQIVEGQGTYPRWSPAGDILAFQAARSDEDPLDATDIYLADIENQEVSNLTADPQSTDAWPTWSPDGERIAFASNRDGDYEIYSMDRSGGDIIQLTNNTFEDDAPIWSNDGKAIVYVSYQNEVGSNLVIMNADGSNHRVLTSGSEYDNFPSWSPDDRVIVFWSTREDGGLFLIDVQTGAVSTVLPFEGSLGSIGLGGPVTWMP